MFAAITKALDSYLKARSEELCTQDHVTREQYEAAVRSVGMLRQSIEKACAEYCFKVKGLGDQSGYRHRFGTGRADSLDRRLDA